MEGEEAAKLHSFTFIGGESITNKKETEVGGSLEFLVEIEDETGSWIFFLYLSFLSLKYLLFFLLRLILLGIPPLQVRNRVLMDH